MIGFGCSVAAEKDGCCGDTARAVGEVGLLCRRKAGELNEKHDIVTSGTKTTKIVVLSTASKANELNEQHGILDRARESAVYAWEVVTDFAGRHRLGDRTVEGVGSAAHWAAEKVSIQLDDMNGTGPGSDPKNQSSAVKENRSTY